MEEMYKLTKIEKDKLINNIITIDTIVGCMVANKPTEEEVLNNCIQILNYTDSLMKILKENINK